MQQLCFKRLKKKVLIVTYYWPPAGGPGVQRWLKFVKYLPENGYEPIVYIPDNPTYPIVDNNLINEVPEGVTILSKPILEPYTIASFFSKKKTKTISAGLIPPKHTQSLFDKFLLWVRGNIFIPDARRLWVSPSVRYLKPFIEEHKIETVITTGPPHSLHLIGLGLKEQLNIQWLADFRDPWTSIGYHKALKLSRYARYRHGHLEHLILNKADKIITTSDTTKREFSKKTNKPIQVITNGYDVTQVVKPPLDEKFSIAHIGSFLLDRNPLILWKCLKEIAQENESFRKDLQIKLIGKISDEIIHTIDSFGLKDSVLNLRYLPHEEAIKHQKSSQVLLLIEIDSIETRGIIPGKLFEYMVSERPILALGPESSDIEPIIRKTNTGLFFEYHQKEELKAAIVHYYKQYKGADLKSHPVGLQEFSRCNLTKKLKYFIEL